MTDDRLRTLFAKHLDEFFDDQNRPRDVHYRRPHADPGVPGIVHPDDLLMYAAWLRAQEYISRVECSLLWAIIDGDLPDILGLGGGELPSGP
jgi:hypothetical protein